MKFTALALLAFFAHNGVAVTIFCTGSIGGGTMYIPMPTTIDANVEVPEGETCTITAKTTVTGSVKAKKNSTLTISDSDIHKDVKGEDDSTITITASNVTSDVDVNKRVSLSVKSSSTVKKINAKEDSEVRVEKSNVQENVEADKVARLEIRRSSTIGGNVEVDGAQGFVTIQESTLGGKLKVVNAQAPDNQLFIYRSSILDDIDIEDNTLRSLDMRETTVGDEAHKAEVKIRENTFTIDNGMYGIAGTILNNSGNIKKLEIVENTWTGGGGVALLVSGNKVNENIKIQENVFKRGGGSGISVKGNCAGDKIEVKENEGGNLVCEGNLENEDPSICSDDPPPTISAEENDFDSIFDQCVEDRRGLRH